MMSMPLPRAATKAVDAVALCYAAYVRVTRQMMPLRDTRAMRCVAITDDV